MKNLHILLLVTAACILLYMAGCVSTKSLQQARDAYRSGNLEQAYASYSRLAEDNPSNAEVQQGLKKTRQALIKRAMSRSESILAQASLKTPSVYREALKPLQRAKKYDPQGTAIPERIRELQAALHDIEQANRQRKALFQRALTSGDFASARKNLERIKKTDPGFPGLQQMEAAWTESFAESLESRMLKHLESGDLGKIAPLQQRWGELPLPQERIRSFSQKIRRRSLNILRDKVRRLMANREYYRAYDAIVSSKATDDLAELMDRIRRKGADHYLSLARKHQEQGNLSRAYLESVKGLELDQNDLKLFTLHRDTRDEILSDLQKYIAIPAFGAPATDPDLGPQFSDALISYLFRILPYGINIVERQKVDLLVKEQNLGAMEAASRLRADLFVSGNVSLLKIDRQESTSQVRVRVKVGEEKSLNPAYEAWLRLPPEQRQKTPAPSQTISTDKHETVTYEKGRTTVKGFGSVALRIFNTQKGAVTYAQEFNANYSVADDFQDGVDYAGIKGDPLELPTNTEIRERLRNRIIEQIADVVKKKFEKREANYLRDANYHLSRKEYEKGLDNLAYGFLYCVKAKISPDNQDFKKIVAKILELTEGRA